jgi:cytochrome c biogenesis protein CcmG, thiol:disulfide interchange protein DsbE
MPWRIFGRLLLQAAAVGVVLALLVLLASRLVKTENARGLASYRGKAVVLNFWASWCDPCKQEAPMLQEAWERNRGRGVVVLGVNAQDFRTDARRFAERYGLTYPIVHDGRGSSLGRYGLTGFPETWWVGRNGRLVAYVQGEFTRDELDRNIERALEAAS